MFLLKLAFGILVSIPFAWYVLYVFRKLMKEITRRR